MAEYNHRDSSYETVRFIYENLDKTHKITFLSATPMNNSPTEIIDLIKLCTNND